MSDKEFLEWIRDRIVHVYGESPNTDFVLRLGDIAQALQSWEPVVFTCHGNNAPAYGCNKPGDMSGTYYKAPQPVVNVNQQLVEALLLFVQNNFVRALVPSTCEIAEEALLSASKETV
jgi:hypothetical protein